jgi:uncharacterized membrane protein YphA (DoxX/SURF4 family)
MKLTIQNKAVSHILRILVGCVFVASAVLKYMAIDVFDLYIFEHNIFNLAVTSTLTRLLITAELTLGIMLICNFYIRVTYFITLFFLAGFTIYLLLQPCLFNVDMSNCYCFGDKIVLNHVQSIVKNIILLGLLLPINTQYYTKKKYEMPVIIIFSVICFTTSLFVYAPDYIYKHIFQTEVRIEVSRYEEELKKSDKYQDFTEGRKIICMYSNKCKYCRNSAIKLNTIIKRTEVDTNDVKCIFWTLPGEEKDLPDYFQKNHIISLEYTVFGVEPFLAITHGKMPVILFSDNGKIVKSIEYTGISEKEMEDFVQGKK